MKIGFLLGSFNPFTIAHGAIVNSILNANVCDKVVIVVAKQNPWKDDYKVSFDTRCHIAEVSTKFFGDKCEVSKVEKYLRSPTYSYMSLDMLKRIHQKDERFLIIGDDVFDNIEKWMKFHDRILPNYKLIKIQRGNSSPIDPTEYPKIKMEGCDFRGIHKNVISVNLGAIDVSSTLVRALIWEGKNPMPFISDEAWKIIKEMNLYKKGI